MQDYNEYTPNTSFHSISAKTFLGDDDPAADDARPGGDLKIALDTLFNHPNVGPFIGKQLIQRLVTSNPSPAYVAPRRGGVQQQRQRRARRHEGGGARRSCSTRKRAPSSTSPTRRQAARAGAAPGALAARLQRHVGQRPLTGIGLTDDPATSLGQTPMCSPSVFNFFRPGYVPPGTAIAGANLAGRPRSRSSHERLGRGLHELHPRLDARSTRRRDSPARLRRRDGARRDAGDLVDRMNLLLFGADDARCAATRTTRRRRSTSRAIA